MNDLFHMDCPDTLAGGPVKIRRQTTHSYFFFKKIVNIKLHGVIRVFLVICDMVLQITKLF